MDLSKITSIINHHLRFGKRMPLCLVLFFLLLSAFTSDAYRLPGQVSSKEKAIFKHLLEQDEKLSPSKKIGHKTLKRYKKYRSVNEHNACLQPTYKRISVQHTDLVISSYYQPAFFPLEQHSFLYRLTYF